MANLILDNNYGDFIEHNGICYYLDGTDDSDISFSGPPDRGNLADCDCEDVVTTTTTYSPYYCTAEYTNCNDPGDIEYLDVASKSITGNNQKGYSIEGYDGVYKKVTRPDQTIYFTPIK